MVRCSGRATKAPDRFVPSIKTLAGPNKDATAHNDLITEREITTSPDIADEYYEIENADSFPAVDSTFQEATSKNVQSTIGGRVTKSTAVKETRAASKTVASAKPKSTTTGESYTKSSNEGKIVVLKANPRIIATLDTDSSSADATKHKREAKFLLTDDDGDLQESAVVEQPSKRVKTANTARVETVNPRPAPSGVPEIWAETRQELCETLANYRAYQSGAYCTNGLAVGFLLANDSSERQYCDDEIIIVRAGGKCKLDSKTGQMLQAQPHSLTDSETESFMNTMQQKSPVIVIVSKSNKNFPTTAVHPFSVLGYFKVSDIWFEKNNGYSSIKYRFEKINLRNRSWWAPATMPDRPVIRDFTKKAQKQRCIICGETSKQIFARGWACLEPECKRFWRFVDTSIPQVNEPYNHDFLEERTEPVGVTAPYDARSELMKVEPSEDAHFAYSREAWKGVICPECGRCNSRWQWGGWSCKTEGCGFTHNPLLPILSPRSVLSDNEREYDGTAISWNKHAKTVKFRGPIFIGNWRSATYDLCPGNTVTHLSANKAINRAPGGADDMFKAMQVAENNKLIRGEINSFGADKKLVSHFASNWGFEYKYAVAVETHPFRDAAPELINSLSLMSWASEQVVEDGQNPTPFNEILMVGYFEKCKMGYHDDGEESLGPVVATLALGGTANFTLRLKSRYHHGLTKTGNYDQNAPIFAGCFLEKERRELQAVKPQISREEFEKRITALYKKQGGRTPRAGPVLLDIEMRHGDVVLMKGGEMQRYFEHQVEPRGKLRFALTARHVMPEFVAPSEHWKAELPAGTVNAYNGAGFEVAEKDQETTSPLPVAVASGTQVVVSSSLSASVASQAKATEESKSVVLSPLSPVVVFTRDTSLPPQTEPQIRSLYVTLDASPAATIAEKFTTRILGSSRQECHELDNDANISPLITSRNWWL